MEITSELIDKLAELSKLEFDEASRNQIKNDLKQIIDFVEQLKELDTTGVEPLIHVSETHNVFRDDVVNNDLAREAALLNAPLHDDKHFKVPKVIRKE
jgi:aspartyl-tRNA(Asn)/glutamyl-tRNA(Gln) amidotransferase subunit C